jgi:sugar phosphate permease
MSSAIEQDTRRGWWNVAAAFFGLSMSYAMFTVFLFGTLLHPLQSEFGWGRAEMSFALTITNVTIVFGSPMLGYLVDRLGVKRLLMPSIIFMGIAVYSMSFLNGNIWWYYAGYFAITFFGLATLPLSYSRVVIGWFDAKRGLALGIALSGFGVGGALAPEIAKLMIEAYGWRSAYQVFAGIVLFVSFPLVLFLLKEAPTQTGEPGVKPVESVVGLSNREAARTTNYWLLLFSFLLVGVAITSILSHLVPMLVDRGMSMSAATRCMSTLAIALIIGRVSSGYLMDRYFAPWVTATFLILGLFSGLIMLAMGAVGGWAFVSVFLIGLALGSEISEIAFIVGRYFGQRSFGQIYGIMFGAFQLGAAVAAPSMGAYYDRFGDYTGALWVMAAMAFVGALLVASMSRYPDLST